MYEKFRNEIQEKLIAMLDPETMTKVMTTLDCVSSGYKFEQMSTELTTYADEVPQLVKMFMVSKKVEGKSDKTLHNYLQLYKIFFRWIRKEPEAVTTNDVRKFIALYQQERGVTMRSMESFRRALSSLYIWATAEEYIEKNPIAKIKPIKYDSLERESLTPLEMETLRNACDSIRDKAMIEFFFPTGCRVGELVVVKKSDVDFSNYTVKLFGKGHKERVVCITPKAYVFLKSYIESREDTSEFLFVSERKPHGQLSVAGVEKQIKMLKLKTGISKLTPHVLRHTTATTLLEKGMPIDQISKYLGHSNLNVTQVYAKTSRTQVMQTYQRCMAI